MEKNVNIKGASIIEILITMLIIALLLMAIVTVFPRMTAHRKSIKESDNARMLAVEVLEKIQVISRNNPENTVSNPHNPIGCKTSLTPKDRLTPAGSAYIMWNDEYRDYEIDGVKYEVLQPEVKCADTGTPFDRVTVTVTWKKANKNRSISVTGVI